MRTVYTRITIGDIKLNFVNNIEIESSWEMLTDTALIVLPAVTRYKVDKVLASESLKENIKVGDEITITTGYDDEFKQVFKGYLSAIKPSIPIELSCEDEMWKLKRTPVSVSLKNATIESLLKETLPDVEVDAFNATLGNFYLANSSASKMLERIKSDYGLRSFFRSGKLIIGKQYDAGTATKHKFKLRVDTIEDDLEFIAKEDVRIKVKAISNNDNGTKETIELGDSDGDTKTLNFYNLNKTELKKYAEAELERMRYDGWRGDFTAFGAPHVAHGDIVEIEDTEGSDKTGEYYVDKVVITHGVDGSRQTITLGARI